MANTVVSSPTSHITTTAPLSKDHPSNIIDTHQNHKIEDDSDSQDHSDRKKTSLLLKSEEEEEVTEAARGFQKLLQMMSFAELRRMSFLFSPTTRNSKSPPPSPSAADSITVIPQHDHHQSPRSVETNSTPTLRQRSAHAQSPHESELLLTKTADTDEADAAAVEQKIPTKNHNHEIHSSKTIRSRKLSTPTPPPPPSSSSAAAAASFASPSASFRGFLNLGLVLLTLSSIHGILGEVVFPQFAASHHVFTTMFWDPLPFVLLGSSFGMFTIASLLVEWLSEWISHRLSKSLVLLISTTLQTSILAGLLFESIGAVLYIQRLQFSQGVVVMLLLLVTFMKTASFAIVSTCSRRDGCAHSPSFKDFVYFLFAPTLVYQHKFARSARMNLRRLLTNLCASTVMMSVFVFLVEFLLGPALFKTVHSWSSSSVLEKIDLALLSSVSYFVTWIVFFWAFFHFGVTAAAEMLRFDDRTFFDSWWNSISVDEFWRTWNLLVQRWLFLHIYKPLVNRGLSRQAAAITVFVVSAIGHEVIISVPLRRFRPYAFTVMMLQIPAAVISKRVFRRRPILGNIFTWLWVMASQCTALILYTFAFFEQ